MAAEKAPAFQFYPKDFLMDGNVAGMSLAERGAYITLLCICWQERSLPADTTRLARMVGCPVGAFRRLWPALEPCFRASSVQPETLIHPRLEKERVKQDAFRKRQAAAGRASAAARQPDTQPEGNHGSTAAQPEVNSALSDLPSPIFDSSKNTIKAAAQTPPSPSAPDESDKNLGVITKIAHEAIDIEGIDADLGSLADAVKSLCALRQIDYGRSSTLVRKAVDSALAQRRRAS